MKQRIARFSPHQNGKVAAILMAVGALVFVVPFMLVALMAAPDGAAPPLLFMLSVPLIYLVLGYVMVVVGCAVYNAMAPHVGGIEFDVQPVDG